MWEGSLLADVLALEGPTDRRTENGALDFDLRVDQSVTPVAAKRGRVPSTAGGVHVLDAAPSQA